MNGVVPETDGSQYPGLERWRGTVDEKLNTIAGSVADLRKDVKEDILGVKQSIADMARSVTAAIKETDKYDEQEHEDFDNRLKILEMGGSYTKGKLVIFAGLAGIVGGGLSSATFGAIIHKLFE
jgi:hypothetical protein